MDAKLAIVAPSQAELALLLRQSQQSIPLAGVAEAWRCRLGASPVLLAVTGYGPRRARRRVLDLLAAEPLSDLLLIGVAGGALPDQRIGDLVVWTGTARPDGMNPVPHPAGSPRLAGALRWAARRRCRAGPWLEVERPLLGASAKREAGEQGAVAIEMESGAVLEAIHERAPECRFAGVRAILDPAGRSLSRLPGVDYATGRIDPWGMAAGLLVRPDLLTEGMVLADRMRRCCARISVCALRFLRAYRSLGR